MDCHYNVYWIKILLTLKTTGKVCLWVGCGMKVSAQWTEEAQVAITLLCEEIKLIANEFINWDTIA